MPNFYCYNRSGEYHFYDEDLFAFTDDLELECSFFPKIINLDFHAELPVSYDRIDILCSDEIF